MKLYAKVKLNGKWTFVQYLPGWTTPTCECREGRRIMSNVLLSEKELVE